MTFIQFSCDLKFIVNLTREKNLMEEIKISIGFVFSIIKSVCNFFPKIINYISRPKAIIEIKNQLIVTRNNQGVESHLRYPCILISFTQDVKVDVRSIKLNNETLTCVFSRDPNFLNQKEENWQQQGY